MVAAKENEELRERSPERTRSGGAAAAGEYYYRDYGDESSRSRTRDRYSVQRPLSVQRPSRSETLPLQGRSVQSRENVTVMKKPLPTLFYLTADSYVPSFDDLYTEYVIFGTKHTYFNRVEQLQHIGVKHLSLVVISVSAHHCRYDRNN